MEIKVSVIIPVYNMEMYLNECIETVINQTLREIEILCINDGSTDKSSAILQRYSEADIRFVIINQDNQGVAASRNRGISTAKGKYIMFMDPDDKYPNNRVIEKLYEAAEKNNVKIAGGEFSDFTLKGKSNQRSDYENNMLYGYLFPQSNVMQYKDYQFDYGYHRFIYDREFLLDNKLLFPDLIRFQDPPFMVKAFTLAEKFYVLNEVTYSYRLEHKIIEWNEKRVNDLLQGIQMNLQWAFEHELYDLYNLTIRRIIYEYKEPIMKQFAISISNERALLAILGVLQGEKQIKELMWQVIEAYQIMNVASRETVLILRDKKQKLENEIKKLLDREQEFAKEYAQIQEEYKRQKGKLETIENSTSYKLGRFLTWIPRKVKMNMRGKVN